MLLRFTLLLRWVRSDQEAAAARFKATRLNCLLASPVVCLPPDGSDPASSELLVGQAAAAGVRATTALLVAFAACRQVWLPSFATVVLPASARWPAIHSFVNSHLASQTASKLAGWPRLFYPPRNQAQRAAQARDQTMPSRQTGRTPRVTAELPQLWQ